MAADGGRVQRLTDRPVQDRFPLWSPDSRRIAFTSARDGNRELYTSRDGTRLVYIADHDDRSGVYVVRAAGGEPRRLIRGPALNPNW